MGELLASVVRSLGGVWLRRFLSGRLDGIRVRGIERAQRALERGPVVFAVTHVSWFDGPVLVHLQRHFQIDGRILMDAGQLQKRPFFGAFGAIGVDRQGWGARRGLRNAAAFLDGAGRALWVFPQGEQRPAHLRPLGLQRGAAWLASRTGATLVPVALDYRWGERAEPAAWVHFGAPSTRDGLQQGLIDGLDEIDLGHGFENVLPSAGRHDVATRALAWIWRGLSGPSGEVDVG